MHFLNFERKYNLIFSIFFTAAASCLFFVTSASAATYGTTTSAVYDAGDSQQPNVISWTETKPANTDIVIQARAGNVAAPDGTWTDWTSTNSGAFISNLHLKRYSQYRAILSSTNNASWPTLDSVTWTYKDIDGVLISSIYNTNDTANVIAGISWTETIEGTADIKFQIRTSADGNTWTDWMGPTGTNDYYTDPTGGEAINSAHCDVSGEKYFQYQVFLSSDGVNNPILSDVTISYVVNSPPIVQNVTASQDENGYVNISYDIKDVDARSGTVTQDYVTPTFAYSLNGGSSWTNIATTSIAFGAAPTSGDVSDKDGDGDIDNKALEDQFLTYTAQWLASTTIPDQYSETFQIKVTINDNELANSTDSETSASGIVDTTVPADTSLRVYATSSPAALALTASDNSALKMRISLDPTFAGANWVDYSSASTISLVSDPDTVYVEFKDAYGNVTAVNQTTPPTPNKTMVQDISNLALDPKVYGLFAAWGVISVPAHDFGAYQVYKSTTGNDDSYEFAYNILSRTQNYYADFNMGENGQGYYKVVSRDANGNVSGWSQVVHGTANGVQDGTEGGGGVETTPPVISNVSSSDITTNSATITWDTDELADSRVDYITAEGGNFTDAPFEGTNTMLNSAAGVGQHSITLSNLLPNTTYYYLVQSTDATDLNTASSTSGVNGYSFKTVSGPTITNVAVVEAKNTSATVTWTTDSEADSYVYYSTNADLSGATQTGISESVTNHSVTISGLTQATKYYFYVTSGVANDKNVIDGEINYFTLTTASDTTAPTITFDENTDVTNINDTSATISWVTSEEATSTLEYGWDTNFASSTLSNDNYNINHSFDLTNLTLGTTYYFRIKSTDANGNTRTADNGGAGYSLTTTDSSDVTPPTITVDPSASPIGDTFAVINWTTNEAANSRVDYGTVKGTYTESASVASFDTTHSVGLSGLGLETKYYYIVTSTDAGGNEVVSSEFSFTTKEKLSEESAVVVRENAAQQIGKESASGGSGIIYVEKEGDVTPPVISQVVTTNITSDSVTINWKTDESADSFIEYGDSSSYGNYQGNRDNSTDHTVSLNWLNPETTYHYRATSIDAKGNLALGPDSQFTTLSITEELQKNAEGNLNYDDVNGMLEQQQNEQTQEQQQLDQEKADGLLKIASQTLQKAMGIIKQTISRVSIPSLESTLMVQQSSIEDLAKVIPAPIMSGEPGVLTTAKTAAITWRTDKESNSLVAIASNDEYKPNDPNPYVQVVGNPSDSTKEHMVVVHDLEPDTVYDYQLRNQGSLGPESRSANFTFQTKKEILEVGNYTVQNVSGSEASFKWATNVESDSTLKYTPYRNNELAVDEAKTKYDKAFTTIHEINVDDFESGVTYKVEMISADLSQNTASKSIDDFSTSKDDLPPIIYQVQTSSAISPGKEAKIQSIISWLTSEPSTTKVYYQQGVASAEKELSESTKVDSNYTKKHVAVITKFDPGKVYSFRVESTDSGGNVSISKVYTILTPQQSDSVFQVIMKNMEDVFGWMKRVK